MPKLVTGNYDTREDLEYWVWTCYSCSGASIADAARSCGCSAGVAHKILSKPRPDFLKGRDREYQKIGTRNVMITK